MKISIVFSEYSSDSVSGETVAVYEQAKALQLAGHEVSLIIRKTDDMRGRPSYPLTAALSAAQIWGPNPHAALKRAAPDIVHIHNLFPNFGSQFLEKWSDRLVFTAHNYRTICARATLWRDGQTCTECPTNTSWNAIRHRCYRNSALGSAPLAFATRNSGLRSKILQHARQVIALNSTSAEILRAHSVAPVSVVPNFVPPRVSMAIKDPLPTPAARYWLYCGRLVEEKGVEWLLKNWPPSEDLLVIAGDGPLSARVKSVQKSNVRYLGSLSRPDILNLMEQAQGVLIPSLWTEGLPTVALEALSVGVPLIMSSLCASSGDLTSSSCGAVFEIDGEGVGLQVALDAVRLQGGQGRFEAQLLFDRSYTRDSWIQNVSRIYDSVANA